ncbi:hypothetical protein MMC30_008862 [Trapelia coarctata]|nr:hypothetical protein [Trapelia coarctata]
MSSTNGQRGGRRGGPGGARGQRGGFNSNTYNRQPVESAIEPGPLKPPPPGLGGGGSFGGRLTEDAQNKEGEGDAKEKDEGAEDVEAEVCFICASPVDHNSVAPCNHRTCHICALRLRALYKTRACAHCRTEARFVIFTDDPTKRFQDFVDSNFEQIDDILGIKYENKEIHDDTVLLLRYNCPDKDCDVACWGWPDLHRHVKSLHHKMMCDLCTRNKKVFTHEHELFMAQELRKHEKFGDDNPGAIDQSGFRGHPECGFCRQRFYGDDELYTHCRDKHERCHICDRRNAGRQQQYYVDYDSLEKHFRDDHFLCSDRDCLDKKFVVFESEIDLKAHQLETHRNDLSKDVRRDARVVDMSSFDYRTPYQEPRGRRQPEGRGGGRGRDPNTEPIPHSAAQPLRRDELAFQRQMAIQSAQSVSTRTFGGQLTSANTNTNRTTGQTESPTTVTATRNANSTNSSFPAIDSLNLSSTSNSSAQTSPPSQHAETPQEQARRLRHTTVTERASVMLKNDALKIADFRTRVSAYRTSALTATEFLDSFFSLFDVPAAELGKLVRELAEIYENESKRTELLKAWNDWRAINEDYPSLPGPSGVLPGSSAAGAGSGGRRILKLKSSTAQSSRSAVSKQGSWGNTAAVTSSQPFPALSANRAGPGKVGPTPWASSSSARPSPAPSRPASAAPASRAVVGSDAFPALPAAAKPNTTIFGLHRGAVKWDDRSGPVVSPWGGNGASSSANASAGGSEAEGEEGLGGGKRKGNKGKKQVVYKFG